MNYPRFASRTGSQTPLQPLCCFQTAPLHHERTNNNRFLTPGWVLWRFGTVDGASCVRERGEPERFRVLPTCTGSLENDRSILRQIPDIMPAAFSARLHYSK